jgi:Fur family iron response transcriptional regulator
MENQAHNWPLDRDAVFSLLQSYDIQPTQQRQQIAQIMFARAQHLSADQVLKQVNVEDASVSKATVYNTLGLFAREGLIREVFIDPNRVFYDSNTQPHHHFFNIDTGVLSDIDSEQLMVSDLPELPLGTEAEAVEVIVRVRNKA